MRAGTHVHGTGFGPYTILDLHALPEDGKGFELEDGWLDGGGYVPDPVVSEGSILEAEIPADKPFTVSIDPSHLLAI